MDPKFTKSFWKRVKAIYFMLRKGISKAKLTAELSLMMLRNKTNLTAEITPDHDKSEYQFSCSNTPEHFTFRRKKGVDRDLITAAIDFVNSSAAASPALPGFGRTPIVRQLRISDSPFVMGDEAGGDARVDEAAEEFITKFYRELRKQMNSPY